MYTNRYRYSNQSNTLNYHDIKSNCLRNRTLFEDPEFPANNTSIFGLNGQGGSLRYSGSIIWKRPVELVQQPQFICDGVSRFDVIQGELGNCWFIAAVANLTLHQGLFVQVVPGDNNSFRPGDYCGAFHFRFWQYGSWIDVIIDDRLPCDRRGELLFLHSSDKREFWSALLEKAYAKLHGCYSSLSGGTPSEALQDFSGGIIEMIDIDESSTDLFYVLKKAYDRTSLITCVLSGRRGYHEERTREGLVRGHAYSVTSVQEIRAGSKYSSSGSLIQLIRIRNPWGDHFEWNGAWSDRSREWDLVDSSVKSRLGVTNQHDGEFWMNIYDFQKQFSRTEICHISPDPVDTDVKLYGQPWTKEIVEGSWVRGFSAGGCMNHSTFATNPQYFFHFEASDADGDADKCTVIVSLIQKVPKRCSGVSRDRGVLSIGFRIFKVNAYYRDGQKMDMAFFKRSGSGSVNSGAYTDCREVSARFELPSGNYCIVPTTYEPNQEGEFLLRVFSEPPSRYSQQPTYYPSPPQPQVLDHSFQNLRISPSAPTSTTVPSNNACPYPTGNSGVAPPLPTSLPYSPNPNVNSNPTPAYPLNPNPSSCPYPTNVNPFPAASAPSNYYSPNNNTNSSCPYPPSSINSYASNNVYSGSGGASPYPSAQPPNVSPYPPPNPSLPYPSPNTSGPYPSAPPPSVMGSSHPYYPTAPPASNMGNSVSYPMAPAMSSVPYPSAPQFGTNPLPYPPA